MDVPSKTCPTCSTPFVDPKHPNKAYCCRACAALARRQRRLACCQTCDIEFMQRHPRQRFCSLTCASPSFGWRRGRVFTRITKQCVICARDYETPPSDTDRVTCSIACRVIYQRKPIPVRHCRGCEAPFTPAKSQIRYCTRACAVVSASRKRRARTGIIGGYKGAKAEMRKLLSACERCDWSLEPAILEMHHCDRDRKNNRRENLAMLCPNCHSLDHFRAGDGQFKSNLGRLPRSD